ncbi:MAG: hypothetical protein H7061_06130 [Bdellovibrionaceae bacterium]|nr:hypothetical protein [Bdellovibrio sp.]
MIDLDLELKNTFTFLDSESAESAQSGKALKLTMTLPKSLSYFAGHFPQFPVLPAVGLIDISLFFTKKSFPQFNQSYLKKIKYLKIKAPLGPDQKINIQISQENESAFSAIWSTDQAPIAELNFAFEL